MHPEEVALALEAKERLSDAWQYTNPNQVYADKYPCTMDEDILTCAQAFLDAPDWHDRPTGPGLWMCVGEGRLRGVIITDRYTQQDIDRGAPFHTRCVYGPIPEPPEDTP